MSTVARFAPLRILLPALAAVALCGCAATAPRASSTPGPPTSAPEPAGPTASLATTTSAAAIAPLASNARASTGTSPSGGSAADPCSLVTQQEVESATALPFHAGRLDHTDCEFIGDMSRNNEMTVVVSLDPENNLAGASVDFADGHTVTVLGRDAWWSPSITELWVDLGGGRTLQVQIIPIDTPLGQDLFPVAETLAKLALNRL